MSNTITKEKRLPLGQVVMTGGIQGEVDLFEISIALRNHSVGRWGKCCAEDAKTNDDALEHGERIISSWDDSKGVRFWIITEADRSSTTVLLPDEY